MNLINIKCDHNLLLHLRRRAQLYKIVQLTAYYVYAALAKGLTTIAMLL